MPGKLLRFPDSNLLRLGPSSRYTLYIKHHIHHPPLCMGSCEIYFNSILVRFKHFNKYFGQFFPNQSLSDTNKSSSFLLGEIKKQLLCDICLVVVFSAVPSRYFPAFALPSDTWSPECARSSRSLTLNWREGGGRKVWLFGRSQSCQSGRNSSP